MSAGVPLPAYVLLFGLLPLPLTPLPRKGSHIRVLYRCVYVHQSCFAKNSARPGASPAAFKSPARRGRPRPRPRAARARAMHAQAWAASHGSAALSTQVWAGAGEETPRSGQQRPAKPAAATPSSKKRGSTPQPAAFCDVGGRREPDQDHSKSQFPKTASTGSGRGGLTCRRVQRVRCCPACIPPHSPSTATHDSRARDDVQGRGGAETPNAAGRELQRTKAARPTQPRPPAYCASAVSHRWPWSQPPPPPQPPLPAATPAVAAATADTKSDRRTEASTRNYGSQQGRSGRGTNGALPRVTDAAAKETQPF